MKIHLLMVVLFYLIALLFHLCSSSTTIVVDGVSLFNNPSLHIGDSIIFKHKFHYELFIFHYQRDFYLCNYTHATLLTKPNSTTFMWHPSRPGVFLFTFNNGSKSSCNGSQKYAVKVSATDPPKSSHLSPDQIPPTAAPAPISGGVVPSPSGSSSLTLPPLMAAEKGGALPFINSNPAVPLPTGEVDSATIRPFQTSHTAIMVFPLPPTLISLLFLLL